MTVGCLCREDHRLSTRRRRLINLLQNDGRNDQWTVNTRYVVRRCKRGVMIEFNFTYNHGRWWSAHNIVDLTTEDDGKQDGGQSRRRVRDRDGGAYWLNSSLSLLQYLFLRMSLNGKSCSYHLPCLSGLACVSDLLWKGGFDTAIGPLYNISIDTNAESWKTINKRFIQ